MSHANITLPITVIHIEMPGNLSPVSFRDYLKNPETAEHRFSDDPKLSKHGPFDPWRLREDFLSWPIDNWKGFVAMTGKFGPFRITKEGFEKWQHLIREAMIRPARQWKDLEREFDVGWPKLGPKLITPLRTVFAWEETPKAYVVTTSSLEAIIATIQIDKLMGATFRVCARHDCKAAPFKKGNHSKQFCSYECAHLAAVRRSREPKTGKKKARGGKE
jgi:hypothetical protein